MCSFSQCVDSAVRTNGEGSVFFKNLVTGNSLERIFTTQIGSFSFSFVWKGVKCKRMNQGELGNVTGIHNMKFTNNQ